MQHIFRFCIPYLKEQRLSIALYTALCIIMCFGTIAMPYVTGRFIDTLTTAQTTSFIGRYAAVFAALGLVQLILGFVSERLYNIAQVRSGYSLNAAAVRHIQNVSTRGTKNRNTAYLSQQINNDSNLAITFCINILQKTVTNALTMLVSLALIIALSPLLGIVTVALNVCYCLIFLLLKKPMYHSDYEVMEAQSEYFSREHEQVCNIKFIQTQEIGNTFIKRLSSSAEAVLKKVLKNQIINYGFTSADTALKTVATIAVFIIGGAAVLQKGLTIGELTVMISFFTLSINATQFFFSLGRDTQEIRVACDRLGALFDVAEQTNGDVLPEEINDIRCSNLSFGYGEGDVLSGVSAHFIRGKIYAFAGENGAGKSTLINLILGLYIGEYSGTISYNGIPMADMDMRALRRKAVGVSEQEPMLLPETLRFNLTLDDDADIDEREFHALCAMLELDALLASLPDGLDTPVSENSGNLSGGEKQKLSLLRALLKKPQILILDEPTSALDKAGRQSLYEHLRKISRDKIIIVSTHDRELLELCDAVLPIQNGKRPCCP